MKPLYQKTCPICGTEFSCNLKCKKYCSKICAEKAKKLSNKKINDNKVKKVLVKTCANCGKQFETSRSRQIFCSIHCQNEHKKTKARKEVVIKKCVVCGKDFPTNKPESVFTCSAKCSIIRHSNIEKQKRKKLHLKICPVCKKEFETLNNLKVYCSRRCQWQAIKKPRGKAETVTKKCVVCGKDFETKNQAVLTCSKECSYVRNLELSKQKRHEKNIKTVCLKVCPICKNEFVPSVKHQKFCSEKCRRAYNADKDSLNRKQRRLDYDFQNEEYVEIHRDILTNLLRRIFNRETVRKNSAKRKPLDDWIKEADICGLSYGKYRAAVEVFGKSFEELNTDRFFTT